MDYDSKLKSNKDLEKLIEILKSIKKNMYEFSKTSIYYFIFIDFILFCLIMLFLKLPIFWPLLMVFSPMFTVFSIITILMLCLLAFT